MPGRIGLTVDGVAVYHAKAAGEDYALVSSDGRLFLYRVKPTFAFVQELIIDGASAGPYFTGIALSNLALGTYDKGLVVVANIYTPSGGTSGELLYVRWDDLVSAVDAGLAIDTAFDIRTLAGSPPLGGGDGGSLDGGSAVRPIGPGIPVASSGGCGATGGTSLALAGMLFAVVSLSRRRR